jgi:hypothetical protein
MVVNERLRASIDVAPRTAAFYANVLDALDEAGIEYLLGGAFAFEVYTDIGGRTKDLDLFLHPDLVPTALRLMTRRGYKVETVARHWLAKIKLGSDFVDVIFGSGNGLAVVDEGWFEHSRPAEVLGREVRLIPAEEMLWSKSFIMERERYDGADIAHLIRVGGRTMDWRRLIDRFGRFWPVLLSHLILYDFAYPSERARVPGWVRSELMDRARQEEPSKAELDEQVCYGSVLSRAQFMPDVEGWGYRDGRIEPFGRLSEADVDSETKRMRKETGKS